MFAVAFWFVSGNQGLYNWKIYTSASP